MTSHSHTPEGGAIKTEVVSKLSSIFQDSYLLQTSPRNGSLKNEAQGKKIGLNQLCTMSEFKDNSEQLGYFQHTTAPEDITAQDNVSCMSR